MIERTFLLVTLLAWLVPASCANAEDVAFRLPREDGSGWIVPGGGATGPAVFLFWSVDCAPCLVELANLARLQAGSPDVRIVLVSLSPNNAARRVLAKMNVAKAVERAQAPRDPQGLLSRLGNGKGALPFAAIFDSSGRLCVSHIGGLTPDVLKQQTMHCR